MARNSFHVDHRKLRSELDALSDEDLFARYERAHQALYGSDSMGIDMIQDNAMLEEMFIQDQAELKIAGELLTQRGLINQFGLRITSPTGSPPPDLSM